MNLQQRFYYLWENGENRDFEAAQPGFEELEQYLFENLSARYKDNLKQKKEVHGWVDKALLDLFTIWSEASKDDWLGMKLYLATVIPRITNQIVGINSIQTVFIPWEPIESDYFNFSVIGEYNPNLFHLAQSTLVYGHIFGELTALLKHKPNDLLTTTAGGHMKYPIDDLLREFYEETDITKLQKGNPLIAFYKMRALAATYQFSKYGSNYLNYTIGLEAINDTGLNSLSLIPEEPGELVFISQDWLFRNAKYHSEELLQSTTPHIIPALYAAGFEFPESFLENCGLVN